MSPDLWIWPRFPEKAVFRHHLIVACCWTQEWISLHTARMVTKEKQNCSSDWQHQLQSISTHWNLVQLFFSFCHAQQLKWTALFPAIHCIVGRKWGLRSSHSVPPTASETLTNDQVMVPVTQPSTDTAKWISKCLLFHRGPLSKAIHPTVSETHIHEPKSTKNKPDAPFPHSSPLNHF